MASIQDVIGLLSLDPHKSSSPFGGQHRTILVSKDFSNSSDFLFNNFLQNFARREPQTPQLLITLSHDWTNYSSTAAKCGYNLRKKQNGGNIEVLNIMQKYLDILSEGKDDESVNLCDYIIDFVNKFIDCNTSETGDNGDKTKVAFNNAQENTRTIKPLVVMIDDLSILLSIGYSANQVYRLFSIIDKTLRDRSKEIQTNKLSHFIVQTTITNITKSYLRDQLSQQQSDCDLNHLISNLENLSDLCIYLRPLETGYSTRVDGTIKIVDNRSSPKSVQPAPSTSKPTTRQNLGASSLFQPKESYGEIGVKKAFFFKLGDRRARLTSNALIF